MDDKCNIGHKICFLIDNCQMHGTIRYSLDFILLRKKSCHDDAGLCHDSESGLVCLVAGTGCCSGLSQERKPGLGKRWPEPEPSAAVSPVWSELAGNQA